MATVGPVTHLSSPDETRRGVYEAFVTGGGTMTNPAELPEINIDFLLGQAEVEVRGNREKRHGTRLGRESLPFHGLKVNRNAYKVSIKPGTRIMGRMEVTGSDFLARFLVNIYRYATRVL